MDWALIAGWALISVGGLCALAGTLFGLLPILPGPPVATLGPVLVVAGMQAKGDPISGWGWLLLAIAVLAGLVVTAIDALSPILGKKLGGTSRGAMVGSYFGLGIALLFSAHVGGLGAATSLVTAGLGILAGALLAVVLLFMGPLLGGMVGELMAMPGEDSARVSTDPRLPYSRLVWEALAAGVAQCIGLLVTTGTKVLYGFAAIAACALLLVLA